MIPSPNTNGYHTKIPSRITILLNLDWNEMCIESTLAYQIRGLLKTSPAGAVLAHTLLTRGGGNRAHRLMINFLKFSVKKQNEKNFSKPDAELLEISPIFRTTQGILTSPHRTSMYIL